MSKKPGGMVVQIEREIAGLEARRDELERAIARLRRIATWARRSARPDREATDREIAGSQSLTNYCRAVLRMNAPQGLTTRDVKRLLTQGGFVWDRFTNPMSAVHTVLKRLVQQGEAVAAIGLDGERRFAARQMKVLALTRQDVEDDAFMKKLLQASSPAAVADLVNKRREG